MQKLPAIASLHHANFRKTERNGGSGKRKARLSSANHNCSLLNYLVKAPIPFGLDEIKWVGPDAAMLFGDGSLMFFFL